MVNWLDQQPQQMDDALPPIPVPSMLTLSEASSVGQSASQVRTPSSSDSQVPTLAEKDEEIPNLRQKLRHTAMFAVCSMETHRQHAI